MVKKPFLLNLLFVVIASMLSLGCSSGGGGGGDAAAGGGLQNAGATPPGGAAKVMLTLSTRGSVTASDLIVGIQMAVHLPAGVSINAVPSPGDPSIMEAASGVITAAGAAAGAEIIRATYPAAGPSHVVTVVINKTTGYPVGDFAVMTCDRASGSNPTSADFFLTDVNPVGANNIPIIGLTAGFTVQME